MNNEKVIKKIAKMEQIFNKLRSELGVLGFSGNGIHMCEENFFELFEEYDFKKSEDEDHPYPYKYTAKAYEATFFCICSVMREDTNLGG